MGHSEKNEPDLPIRGPEFKLEIAAATGLNCLQLRAENTRLRPSWRSERDSNCRYVLLPGVFTSVDGSAKSPEERGFICERRGRTRGPRSRLSRSSTLISTTSRVTRPSLTGPRTRARDRCSCTKISVRGFQTRHQLDTAEAQYTKYLKLWRSLGESNSCFRRERAASRLSRPHSS